MIKSIIATFFFAFLFSTGHAQEKLLTRGMKISQSLKIKKSSYLLDAVTDLSKPVIIIEGKNITIDFNNITISGSNKQKDPDRFFGTAIIMQK